MAEADARTFLDRFPTEQLAQRDILHGDTRLLNNRSVTPLIELMAEHSISRLASSGRDWFLDADGTFRNPRSAEATSGNVASLRNPGNVFNEQNASLNPHYAGGQITAAEDVGKLTLGLERHLQRPLRENIGQLELGLAIVDGGIGGTLASRANVSAAPPTVQVLVDQAAEAAATRSSRSAGAYNHFARDLAAAVSDPATPIEGQPAFAPLRGSLNRSPRRYWSTCTLR